MSSLELPLWMSVEPKLSFTQLLLAQPGTGALLKARLSPTPARAGGLALLLEALSAWEGRPVFAVVDADAEDVQRHPEAWARLVGEASNSAHVTVEWSHPATWKAARPRFFEGMGNFASARKMLGRTALGELA
jgi:hypothetical protein